MRALGFQRMLRSCGHPSIVQNCSFKQLGSRKARIRRQWRCVFLFDNVPWQPILRPSRIPKTLVFFDSKNETYTAMEGCRYWLQNNKQPDKEIVQHCNYTLQGTMDTVKVYHSNTAKADKEAISRSFGNPDRNPSFVSS